MKDTKFRRKYVAKSQSAIADILSRSSRFPYPHVRSRDERIFEGSFDETSQTLSRKRAHKVLAFPSRGCLFHDDAKLRLHREKRSFFVHGKTLQDLFAVALETFHVQRK